MPGRSAAQAHSDSEDSASRSSRKGQQRSPEKERSSKQKAAEEEVAEEDEDEEEEYEVERIIKAQKGMVKLGSMAYLIKWKGYPDSENSWVDEEDLLAEELKASFWEQENARKQKAKQTTGRKSDVSSWRNKPEPIESKSSSGGNSKRGRKSTNKVDEDAEMDMEEVTEVEPPKKKSRTNKKAAQSGVPASRSASPSERFIAADENGNSNYDVNTMEKYMKKMDWTDIIDKIETVEQMEDHALLVYFITKDGERSVQDSSVVGKRCPSKLLKFYEDHLRWRGQEPNQSE